MTAELGKYCLILMWLLFDLVILDRSRDGGALPFVFQVSIKSSFYHFEVGLLKN